MACITGETIATTSICITQPIARTITRAWWCCLCFGDQRFVYTQQQQQQQQRRRVERPRIIHTHSNYVYLDVLMACFLGIKCNSEGVVVDCILNLSTKQYNPTLVVQFFGLGVLASDFKSSRRIGWNFSGLCEFCQFKDFSSKVLLAAHFFVGEFTVAIN